MVEGRGTAGLSKGKQFMIVGQKYAVPVIDNTPVLLPGHVDLDFPCISGNKVFHYHKDFRFIDEIPDMRWAIRGTTEPRIELRVCVRPEHPPFNGNLMFMQRQMYHKYADCKAKDGICPHKGTKIENGECPAHGLRFKSDGSLRYRFEDIRYEINDQRIVGHDSGFEAIIEKTGQVTEVRLVCRGEVIATYPIDAYFSKNDQFIFHEECK